MFKQKDTISFKARNKVRKETWTITYALGVEVGCMVVCTSFFPTTILMFMETSRASAVQSICVSPSLLKKNPKNKKMLLGILRNYGMQESK